MPRKVSSNSTNGEPRQVPSHLPREADPTVPHHVPSQSAISDSDSYGDDRGASAGELTVATPAVNRPSDRRRSASVIHEPPRPADHTRVASPVQVQPPPAYTPNHVPTHTPDQMDQALEYAQERHYRRGNGSGRTAEWAWVAVALGALIVTLVLGGAGYAGIRLIAESRSTDSALAAVGTATPGELPTSVNPEASPTMGFAIKSWDGKQRFTLLLMGLDKRPGERGTAFRTDSMIIVSLDPVTKSIGMLSIPRDLYINIPPNAINNNASYGLQRVNSAYTIGELASPNGGGAQLAMQTVQYNLGIRINDYIVYDFEAVVAAIDAVGGIEINVEKEIIDNAYPDMTYGIERLYIQPGLQHMNGELALKYARTRHGSSDVERARRQQQVMYALRDKILSKDLLPTLIPSLPGLYNSMSGHVQSGLGLDQLIALGLFAKDVQFESIKRGVIDYRNVTPTMWDGMSVLIPNRSTLAPLLIEVFGANYND